MFIHVIVVSRIIFQSRDPIGLVISLSMIWTLGGHDSISTLLISLSMIWTMNLHGTHTIMTQGKVLVTIALYPQKTSLVTNETPLIVNKS